MGNANTTENDDFDMDFAGLDTFVPETAPKAKPVDTRNYRAESFETIAEGVASPANVRYVGISEPMAHVWISRGRGWSRFSARLTRMDSAEQNKIIADAQVAHPGADIGVSAKRTWL
jgi:hypothetical protein